MTDSPAFPWMLPPKCDTARQIIEARLGRPLGPIRDMPKDLHRAMYLLALQLNRRTK